MDSNDLKSPTEALRLKVIKRVILVFFGCLLASALTVVLPALYFMPARVESYSIVPTVTTPGVHVPPPPPTTTSTPIGAYIPLVIMLAVVIALGYGVYDAIRLFVQYRKSKQMDEVMFP